MNILFVVLVFTILYAGSKLYKGYKKQRKLHEYVDAFPGDKWYPIIGSSWRFLTVKRENSFEHIKGMFKEFGPTWRLWIGNKPMIFISKLEDLEMIFKHTVNINKGGGYRFVLPWLGNGLITAGGEMWKIHRKLLNPAFHFQILDKHSEVFYTKSQELVDIFKMKNDDYIDIFPYITRWGLDVIAETGMGVKFDCLKNPDSEYAKAIFKMCELFAVRMRRPWYHNDFMFNLSSPGRIFKQHLTIIKDTNMKIISQRRAEYQKLQQNTKADEIGRKEKLALLDILLQNPEKNNFTDKEICDEVSTFMFAGQDTTASTVTFAMLALANNPEIQAKVHQELDNIFHGEDRPVTPQDLADMEYLERVIKETLRQFTVVPMIGRKVDEEMTIDGKLIPPGVDVQLCLYQMHHDPELWPNPDRFDPDRFLPENSVNRNLYAFSPFSAGWRNCLGRKFGTRNAKTALASIMRKFTIRSLERTETFKFVSEIVLRPLNGPHIKFQLRN